MNFIAAAASLVMPFQHESPLPVPAAQSRNVIRRPMRYHPVQPSWRAVCIPFTILERHTDDLFVGVRLEDLTASATSRVRAQAGCPGDALGLC